jgi:hypothetical protein
LWGALGARHGWGVGAACLGAAVGAGWPACRGASVGSPVREREREREVRGRRENRGEKKEGGRDRGERDKQGCGG